MKTLIFYCGHDGQTYKIACTIATHFMDRCKCDVVDLRNAGDHNIHCYQRVVIGAAVRYGHYVSELNDFIQQQINWLNKVPSAFYSVNLAARNADKCTPATNIYTRKFLAKSLWKPDLCAVFAGALRYSCYSWFDRVIMQLIMQLTSGETDRKKVVEYTDWQQVAAFAGALLQLTGKRIV